MGFARTALAVGGFGRGQEWPLEGTARGDDGRGRGRGQGQGRGMVGDKDVDRDRDGGGDKDGDGDEEDRVHGPVPLRARMAVG